MNHTMVNNSYYCSELLSSSLVVYHTYSVMITVYFAVVNPCHESPCRNTGVCTVTESGYVCTCTDGYRGSNCESKLFVLNPLLFVSIMFSGM